MAVKAYQKTSRYDLLISNWLREEKIKKNSYQKNKLILDMVKILIKNLIF